MENNPRYTHTRDKDNGICNERSVSVTTVESHAVHTPYRTEPTILRAQTSD